MDEYQKEKMQRLRNNGLRECCGVVTEMFRPCAFRLCPIEREKELLKARKSKEQPQREEKPND